MALPTSLWNISLLFNSSSWTFCDSTAKWFAHCNYGTIKTYYFSNLCSFIHWSICTMYMYLRFFKQKYNFEWCKISKNSSIAQMLQKCCSCKQRYLPIQYYGFFLIKIFSTEGWNVVTFKNWVENFLRRTTSTTSLAYTWGASWICFRMSNLFFSRFKFSWYIINFPSTSQILFSTNITHLSKQRGWRLNNMNKVYQ